MYMAHREVNRPEHLEKGDIFLDTPLKLHKKAFLLIFLIAYLGGQPAGWSVSDDKYTNLWLNFQVLQFGTQPM